MGVSQIYFERVNSGFIVRSLQASDCEVIIRLAHHFQAGIQSELTVEYHEEPETAYQWSVKVDELKLWPLLAKWIIDHYASNTGWLCLRDNEQDTLFFSIPGELVYRP